MPHSVVSGAVAAGVAVLPALLSVAGLAVAAALWVVVQRWSGRYAGEAYPMEEEVGRCGSCTGHCRE